MKCTHLKAKRENTRKVNSIPQVSVVFPIGNADSLNLVSSLEALLRQSLKNIEIICVLYNLSKFPVLNYAITHDKRVRILYKKHKDLNTACNYGIRNTKADFLIFTNSNNLLQPDSLEKMLQRATQEKSELVACQTAWYNQSIPNNFKGIENLKTSPVKPEDFSQHIFLFDDNLFLNKLIKKLFLIKNNLLLKENAQYGVNLLIGPLACACAKKISLLREVLVYQKPDRFQSLPKEPRSFEDALKSFIHFYQKLKELRIRDTFSVSLNVFIKYQMEKILKIYPISHRKENILSIAKHLSPELVDAIFWLSEPQARVSVIVFVNSEAKTLKKCLESVTRQTLKEIEIICVNTVNNKENSRLLKEYAQNDKRITIIDKENLTLSEVYDKALTMSTGLFVLFLNSCDYLDPKTLESLYFYSHLYKHDICLMDLVNNQVKLKRSNILKNISEQKTFVFYNRNFLIRKNIRWSMKKINKQNIPFSIVAFLRANQIGEIILDKSKNKLSVCSIQQNKPCIPFYRKIKLFQKFKIFCFPILYIQKKQIQEEHEGQSIIQNDLYLKLLGIPLFKIREMNHE